jgi:hypothetical protein
MSEDIYRRLAQRLDAIPNGFPATQSGAELRLLAKIFTPEEATLASVMRLTCEPAADIEQYLDVPWVPTAIEQRDGRGIRYGNQNKEVDIFRYVSVGSLDELSWGVVGCALSIHPPHSTVATTRAAMIRFWRG